MALEQKHLGIRTQYGSELPSITITPGTSPEEGSDSIHSFVNTEAGKTENTSRYTPTLPTVLEILPCRGSRAKRSSLYSELNPVQNDTQSQKKSKYMDPDRERDEIPGKLTGERDRQTLPILTSASLPNRCKRGYRHKRRRSSHNGGNAAIKPDSDHPKRQCQNSASSIHESDKEMSDGTAEDADGNMQVDPMEID